MSTSSSASTKAIKKALVCIGHNKRVVTFSTNLEERIREAFSDILHNGESIILQVEENWGVCTFFVDVQQKDVADGSIVQVVRQQQVSTVLTKLISTSYSVSFTILFSFTVCMFVCECVRASVCFNLNYALVPVLCIYIIRFLPCNNTLINSGWTYM